jgi:CRISPR-associated protein Csb2
VPPLPVTAFDVVGYRRDTDSAPRPVVAFELHKTVAELAELPASASKYRPFDPVRTPDFARKNGGDHHPCGAVVVSGLVRHAAAAACREQQWSEARVNSFVLGHGDQKDGQATTDDRLQFLPLPSITPLKVESIRRVLIAGPPGADVSTFQRLLNGRELFALGHDQPVAMLALASRADGPVREYLRSSCVWSTVTPVVLPGYDDPSGVRKRLSARTAADAFASGALKTDAVERLDAEVRKLLLRAFAHAGVPSGLLSAELLSSGAAGLEWREVGFRAGVGRSREYRLGSQPGYPRYHVRVRFAQQLGGPLCVGNGRYRGLGLFAAE